MRTLHCYPKIAVALQSQSSVRTKKECLQFNSVLVRQHPFFMQYVHDMHSMYWMPRKCMRLSTTMSYTDIIHLPLLRRTACETPLCMKYQIQIRERFGSKIDFEMPVVGELYQCPCHQHIGWRCCWAQCCKEGVLWECVKPENEWHKVYDWS